MLRVMLCPTCGKESHNIRVCAHCQTPYPKDASVRAGDSSSSQAAAARRKAEGGAYAGVLGDLRRILTRPSSTMRQIAVGLLVVFAVGYYLTGRERTIPAGVVLPNVIATAMSENDAAALLTTVGQTAKVEEREGTLTVQIPAATFPSRREGLLAFAQQYARADEIVQRRKRAISFLDPTGSLFAQADPAKGVMLTR